MRRSYPHQFVRLRCFPTDPVMLCATGQIYDYSAIRPWLSNSNWRCPKTNTVIADPSVARVPALRQAAVKWAEENNIDTSEDYLHPPSSLSVAELESRCLATASPTCRRGSRVSCQGR